MIKNKTNFIISRGANDWNDAFHILGDSRLVFVWPQKADRARLSNVLAPLLRGILVGLLFVDALHLWPGEFLPTSLPSINPIALPPVKCNIIEPRWFDNNWLRLTFALSRQRYFFVSYFYCSSDSETHNLFPIKIDRFYILPEKINFSRFYRLRLLNFLTNVIRFLRLLQASRSV